MARRSATNPRYQKHHEPAGQTRKSAAAAKPSRSSSSAPAKKSGSSKPAKSSSAAKRRPMMVNPTTPEFKRLRSIWWALLGGGLVLTTISWAMREYLQTSWAMTASNVVLALAYGCIFFALYLDWTKMRPMRQAAYQNATPSKSSKAATKAAEKTSAADTADTAAGKSSADSSDSSDTTGA